MKVALFGEGKNDFGYENFDKKKCQWYWEEGTIQPLMRNFVFFQDSEIEAIPKDETKKVSYTKGKNFITESNFEGVALKLLYFIKIQRDNIKNYDFIVFYSDSDKESYPIRYQKINTALKYISEKYGIDGVVMMPHKILENWLLGCPSAYKKTFGKEPQTPKLPKKPEDLWGTPESPNYPKKYLEKVLAQFDRESNTELFKEIAKNIDIEELRLKCPISFDQFCEDLHTFS